MNIAAVSAETSKQERVLPMPALPNVANPAQERGVALRRDHRPAFDTASL